MSTLGLIGLVVVALAGMVLLVRRRRAAPVAAARPRTVADLVQLRAEEAGWATDPPTPHTPITASHPADAGLPSDMSAGLEPASAAASADASSGGVVGFALDAVEPAAGSRCGSIRPRRSPAETAAEQTAADRALLRMFGFAETTGPSDPDRAQVVSLAGAREPNTHPDVDDDTAQPVGFRVVGRDGTGVAGATVTLLDDHGRAAASGSAGVDSRGGLRAPRPGCYVLVCTAPDHQPGAVAITVAAAPVDADVLLARSATLSGTVYGEDGPIASARVMLVQDGEIVDAVDTGPDGAYRIGDLGAGEYGMSVSAAECEPLALLLHVPDEADLSRDIDLEPEGLPRHPGAADDLVISAPLGPAAG